jgi:hypothetical protein
MKAKYWIIGWAVIIASSTLSSAEHYRAYSGPALPHKEIGICSCVFSIPFGSNNFLQLTDIDGQGLPPAWNIMVVVHQMGGANPFFLNSHKIVELLPGPHVLTYQHVGEGTLPSNVFYLTVVAGKSYTMVSGTDLLNTTYTYNGSNGRPISHYTMNLWFQLQQGKNGMGDPVYLVAK